MKDFIRSLAEESGRIAMTAWRSNELKDQFKEGNSKDVVTRIDREIESYIRKEINTKYPHHSILGEEEGMSGEGDHRWIIDPIDGTASYAHGQRNFSISIAYEYQGTLEAASVYAPAHNEFFYAEKGRGATLNGEPIEVSTRNRLDISIAATGFACLRAGKERNNLENFCRIVPRLRGIRRLGSAALDLAYVACGQFDAFWELYLNSYDIAAGLLLVQEAGGRVSDFSGGIEGIPGELLVSNGFLHESLMELLV